VDQANILVVEDDDIVALTIERCLRREDYRVTLANSGVEALQQARRHKPEMVILDVIMPGMDGFAVCREMRADPILADVPILFLTARTKPEDRIMGFHVGADDYLSKPFNLDELTLRVRSHSAAYTPQATSGCCFSEPSRIFRFCRSASVCSSEERVQSQYQRLCPGFENL